MREELKNKCDTMCYKKYCWRKEVYGRNCTTRLALPIYPFIILRISHTRMTVYMHDSSSSSFINFLCLNCESNVFFEMEPVMWYCKCGIEYPMVRLAIININSIYSFFDIVNLRNADYKYKTLIYTPFWSVVIRDKI